MLVAPSCVRPPDAVALILEPRLPMVIQESFPSVTRALLLALRQYKRLPGRLTVTWISADPDLVRAVRVHQVNAAIHDDRALGLSGRERDLTPVRRPSWLSTDEGSLGNGPEVGAVGVHRVHAE